MISCCIRFDVTTQPWQYLGFNAGPVTRVAKVNEAHDRAELAPDCVSGLGLDLKSGDDSLLLMDVQAKANAGHNRASSRPLHLKPPTVG